MRLLHTGDLHFGAGARFADDRLREQEDHWQGILELAVERKVDAVVVGGDIWHRPRPTPAEYLAFIRPMHGFESLPILAIPGNHDYLAANQPTGLEVPFRDHLRIYLGPTIEDEVPVGRPFGGIGFLPWTPPHRLVAANPGMSRDEVNELVANALLLAATRLRDDGAEVLVAHWAVSGAVLPSGELAQSIMREPILNGWALSELGFKAVVLGHIHRYQHIVEGASPVLYTGSPMPLDFGEGGYPHGVVILDTSEEGDDQVEFVPLQSRPFVTVDRREDPEAARALAFASKQVDRFDGLPAGAVVRLRYCATREEQAEIDTARLVEKFERAGAHRVFVLPEIVKDVRARVEVADLDDAGPVEHVERWMVANGLADKDGAFGLVDLTKELLQEVGA